MITPRSINSEWLNLELGAAWALQKEIIPVLLNVEIKDINDILNMCQACILESEDQVNKLIDELSAIIDFAAFWNLFLNQRDPNGNFYVVLSAKMPIEYKNGQPVKGSGHTALVSYNELDAFLKFQHELNLVSDKIKVVHGGVFIGQFNEKPEMYKIPDLPIEKDGFIIKESNDFIIPKFSLNQNLIVLGSPHANLVCKKIMTKCDPPFRFIVENGEKYIETENGSYLPTNDKKSSNEIEEDYGILLRITNPFDGNRKNKILILAGNHGFGTEAAMKLVANRELIKSLREKVGDEDFEALFRARVYKNKASELDLKIIKVAKLVNGNWGPIISYEIYKKEASAE